MKRLFDCLDAVLEYMGISIASLMIAIAFLQVVFRYVLQNALSWSEEACIFLFVWMSYVGMALAMRKDAHLRVDAFVNLMPQKVQHVLHWGGLLVSALFCLAVAWMSTDLTLKIYSREQTAVAIDMPMWIVWLGIPLCFLLTALQALRRFWIVFTTAQGRGN